MSTHVNQDVPRSFPRELAIAIMTAGLAALYVLAVGDAIGAQDDKLSPSDFPESTRKKVNRAKVKILRLDDSGEAERLPLASGFIVATSWEDADDHVYVVTRRSNLGTGTKLAICFFPYVRRTTAYGPPNVCSAEIVCEDEKRDLALLHGIVRNQSFDWPALSLTEYGGCSESPIYCEGFVKEGIWSSQSYGRSHLLLARIVADHSASSPPATGLPQAELVEISTYAPIDRAGILSGAPVVDRNGLVVGIWKDRQPFSRFFISAWEVLAFFQSHGFDPANP